MAFACKSAGVAGQAVAQAVLHPYWRLMHDPSPSEADPLRWCAAISLGFAAMAAWHLGIPSKMYFDEVHYVPAARALLALQLANAEHPLLAKEAIAAAIAAFGDRPPVWRLPSLIMGSIGLFAFGRALWWASQRRFATLAGMVLLATDFAWFIQSRIAMLDMVMAGFTMLALWQIAATLNANAPYPRRPGLDPGSGFLLRSREDSPTPGQARGDENLIPLARNRWRLALAGVSFGLALGAKWSVAPVIAFVALALVAARLRAGKAPIPGVTMAELLFWLLSVPILVYWLTFLPAFFYSQYPLTPPAFLAWQRYMLQLQESVLTRHPYQSVWYQWLLNWRAIWYLYERVDGAQRGIVLIGNPFTMLAGLPALLWCLWAGRQRADALAVAGLYVASLGMWIVAAKPVQFYYHYLLPGSFLIAALALALDALWRRVDAWRWTAPASLALSCALFGYFHPIISGAALAHGPSSFQRWMWLASWR